MRSVSFVSIYNHIIVNSDISGSDKIIDPNMILFFATSEAIKIISGSARSMGIEVKD